MRLPDRRGSADSALVAMDSSSDEARTPVRPHVKAGSKGQLSQSRGRSGRGSASSTISSKASSRRTSPASSGKTLKLPAQAHCLACTDDCYKGFPWCNLHKNLVAVMKYKAGQDDEMEAYNEVLSGNNRTNNNNDSNNNNNNTMQINSKTLLITIEDM